MEQSGFRTCKLNFTYILTQCNKYSMFKHLKFLVWVIGSEDRPNSFHICMLYFSTQCEICIYLGFLHWIPDRFRLYHTVLFYSCCSIKLYLTEIGSSLCTFCILRISLRTFPHPPSHLHHAVQKVIPHQSVFFPEGNKQKEYRKCSFRITRDWISFRII
jgi:hypothetical protein